MRKENVHRILKLIALILPVVLLVCLLQSHLFYYSDANTERLRNFYREDSNSLDVVILGASEVFFGYSPGHAYENNGYTSYSYAINSNPGILYEAQLKDIVRYQDPQIIMVEIWGYLYADEGELYDSAPLQVYSENTPFSLHKLKAILEHPYEEKLSCLLPFVRYHKDWSDLENLKYNLEKKMLDNGEPSMLKGIHTITGIYDPTTDTTLAEEAMGDHLLPEARQSLIGLLEYCRQMNMQNVVFLNFPRYLTSETDNGLSLRMEEAVGLIHEYGYSFLDLQAQSDAIGLEGYSDYYDAHHLNIYGQKKLTEYLGNLLCEQYGLVPMDQNEENRRHWEECVSYTNAFYDYAQGCIENGMKVSIGQEVSLLFRLEELRETAE